jgi:hypothetical protein
MLIDPVTVSIAVTACGRDHQRRRRWVPSSAPVNV